MPFIEAGDEITVVTTSVTPFGALVEFQGTPGLVRGAQAAVGESLRVRVDEYDAAQMRFSATAQ